MIQDDATSVSHGHLTTHCKVLSQPISVDEPRLLGCQCDRRRSPPCHFGAFACGASLICRALVGGECFGFGAFCDRMLLSLDFGSGFKVPKSLTLFPTHSLCGPTGLAARTTVSGFDVSFGRSTFPERGRKPTATQAHPEDDSVEGDDAELARDCSRHHANDAD
jgi:hypothetical protein